MVQLNPRYIKTGFVVILAVSLMTLIAPILYDLADLLFFKNQNPQNQISTEFNQLNEEEETEKVAEEVSPDIKEYFKDNPLGLETFKYAWGLKIVGLADDWQDKNSPFMADIISVNTGNKTLIIMPTMPEIMPLVGKQLTVSAECTPEESFLYDEPRDKTMPNIDFWGKVTPDYALETYCLDDACENIGRLCKLIPEEFTRYANE